METESVPTIGGDGRGGRGGGGERLGGLGEVGWPTGAGVPENHSHRIVISCHPTW